MRSYDIHLEIEKKSQGRTEVFYWELHSEAADPWPKFLAAGRASTLDEALEEVNYHIDTDRHLRDNS